MLYLTTASYNKIDVLYYVLPPYSTNLEILKIFMVTHPRLRVWLSLVLPTKYLGYTHFRLKYYYYYSPISSSTSSIIYYMKLRYNGIVKCSDIIIIIY